MAVDSRQKRLSMLNFEGGDLLPDPNTSGVDASERQTFLDKYSGIAFAGAAGGFFARIYYDNLLAGRP